MFENSQNFAKIEILQDFKEIEMNLNWNDYEIGISYKSLYIKDSTFVNDVKKCMEIETLWESLIFV